jgi:hypothetical protein
MAIIVWCENNDGVTHYVKSPAYERKRDSMTTDIKEAYDFMWPSAALQTKRQLRKGGWRNVETKTVGA